MVKKLNLIILLVLLAMGLILPLTSKADKQTITISPVKIEVKANPGETVSRVLKVKNLSEGQKKYYINLVNFIPQGEEGGAQFLPPEQGEESYSLAHWIDISKDPINLAAKGEVKVPFNINVPANAEPGSHFGLIFIESKPPTTREGATAVAIGSRVGAMIFVTVAGEIKEEGYIKEFSTLKKFYQHTPVNFIVRFENSGNINLKPVGKIEIFSWREKQITELTVNEKMSRVLPKSIRKFEAVWESQKRFLVGKYTAQIALNYGNPNQIAEGKISFWIIPWKYISGVIIGLIILIGLCFIGVKRYNRWIIRKASGTKVVPQKPIPEEQKKVEQRKTKLCSQLDKVQKKINQHRQKNRKLNAESKKIQREIKILAK